MKEAHSVQRVPEIAAWDDAKQYLDELKRTIWSDIRPLLDVKGYAPFAICREVFSYVDHLEHLYSGKLGDGKVGERFQDYLKEVLSGVDPNYGGNRAKQIYLMYRNGPVHEFQPKVLENDRGQLLKWMCYPGERTDKIEDFPNPGADTSVTHLEPVGPIDNQWWLPVSTKCLIHDLSESIDKFAGAVARDERICAWNRTARELNTPRPWTGRSF